jgi:hypothetical protein
MVKDETNVPRPVDVATAARRRLLALVNQAGRIRQSLPELCRTWLPECPYLPSRLAATAQRRQGTPTSPYDALTPLPAVSPPSTAPSRNRACSLPERKHNARTYESRLRMVRGECRHHLE